MQTKTNALTFLEKLTSLVDRQSSVINSRDLKAIKVLVRVVDGELQEPELSVDLKRFDRK